MELIRSRSGRDGELRARRAAEFGDRTTIVWILYSCMCVDRHHVVIATVVAGGLRRAGAGRTEIDVAALRDADVGADAVDGEIIGVSALAVDAELPELL